MVHFSLRVAIFAAWAAVANAAPMALTERAGPVLPSLDSFYAVPDNVGQARPGTILKHRKTPFPVAVFGIAPVNLEESHQILYRTTDSTIVTQAELLLIEAALEQGWVVAIPDFQGPKAAYLANRLAGYATLDGIRAALNSASITGIQSNPTITMWGYSGGSVATNWAAELQEQYAPELKIAGAAVGGTVPDITNVVTAINKKAAAGLIPTGILGLGAEYPDLKEVITNHIRPEAANKFYKAGKQCLVANAAEFLFQDIIGMFDDRELVYTNPTAVRILQENAFGRVTPSIPLYWYKSVRDEVSPVKDSDAVVDQYCTRGANIEYVRDIASDHGSYAIIGASKALSWLKNIMDGGEAQSGCSKKTVVSSLADVASAEILPKLIVDALLDLLGKPVGPILFG
ncbi:hypothetical protein QQS21_000820 [Conoideocrella luteorostrata]|uniref:Secretory lipase n=1 Tax=Conoideocrella luteorostrata TaxID=1105319 RepID=A0AAJ0CYA1_9HYPO|nr:hypothetical protein QQS21_000820 [Conoideocrella luteorostrata]